MSVVFRSIADTPDTPDAPDGNIEQRNIPITGNEPGKYIDPAESGDIILSAMGFEETSDLIPSEDRESLKTIQAFINKVIADQGLKPEASSYRQVLDDLKADLDLSENTDPSVILNKAAGVINAWRDLAFIKDPKERRSIFMKLARQPDNKAMSKIIFEEMDRRKIYR